MVSCQAQEDKIRNIWMANGSSEAWIIDPSLEKIFLSFPDPKEGEMMPADRKAISKILSGFSLEIASILL
ncbi:MAG: hypothetical protein AAFU64_08780 [Bacteroidota bacterium]